MVNTVNLNLENGKNYTIYVTGSATSNNSVVTNDNTSAPSTGQAKVRFVNLSSLLSSASIMLDNSSTVSNSLAFGSTSDFTAVSAGAHNFKVSSAANSNVTVNSNLTLQAGRIYTVYVTGNTVLALSLVANN